jgi:hypothetical protein
MAMCYKDMTFCNALCANEGCPRNYTKEAHEAAKRWWSDNAPVALSDLSEGCPEYVMPKNWN